MKQIKFKSKLFVIFFSPFLLISCSQNIDNSISKVTIKIPDQIKESRSVNAYGAKSCFAVSLRGSGLPTTPAGPCDSDYGIFVGLFKAGQSIELEARYGDDRILDIYYVSSNNGCVPFDPNLGLATVYGTNRVYRISHNPGLVLNKAEMTITIPVEIPAPGNSLAAIHSEFPDSCQQIPGPTLAANPRARVVLGARGGTTANGSVMRVRILDQQIKLNAPDWAGQIRPHRLGDDL